MSSSKRQFLKERYAAGPQALREAFDDAPSEAHSWRPSEADWSIHEIIVHCADSETYAAIRIRLLAAETTPVIVGYDQELWARILNYHARPLEPAFAVIETVRSSTAELIASLDDSVWSAVGTHSEVGAWSAEDWLQTYSSHLHDHADQIRSNIEKWRAEHPG